MIRRVWAVGVEEVVWEGGVDGWKFVNVEHGISIYLSRT